MPGPGLSSSHITSYIFPCNHMRHRCHYYVYYAEEEIWIKIIFMWPIFFSLHQPSAFRKKYSVLKLVEKMISNILYKHYCRFSK